jgi:hypothetical protein
LEGRDHGLMQVSIPTPARKTGTSREATGRISGSPAEILTEYLRNTGLDRYCQHGTVRFSFAAKATIGLHYIFKEITSQSVMTYSGAQSTATAAGSVT